MAIHWVEAPKDYQPALFDKVRWYSKRHVDYCEGVIVDLSKPAPGYCTVVESSRRERTGLRCDLIRWVEAPT